VVPKSEEAINYGIPTLKLNGKNLVHFVGYENHKGFYPGSKAVLKFTKEIASYKSAKGSIQFPIDKKMPLTLISKIVKFAVAESELRAKKKTIKPRLRISKCKRIIKDFRIIPKPREPSPSFFV